MRVAEAVRMMSSANVSRRSISPESAHLQDQTGVWVRGAACADFPR